MILILSFGTCFRKPLSRSRKNGERGCIELPATLFLYYSKKGQMTLGNAIKTLRTACKVKQRDLAVQMGVSANYVSLVEGDKREPSIAFLKKLSRQLGIPVSMFFLWQENDGAGVD